MDDAKLQPRSTHATKIYFLHDFGEQGSPVSTKKLQNGVDTARHGLILRQHGATAYTELLEANFLQYLFISDAFLMKIIDFPSTRVWGVEHPAKNQKILTLGWSKGG